MKHDVCFASFKYPSLSRGGVKRPDDILYPGALTERHEKAQQCYQARMFCHFFLFSFTWTCSWQCSMGLPSFCRGQAGTWPAEGNNIRNPTLLNQETKQQNRHNSDVKVHLSVQLKRLQFTSFGAAQKKVVLLNSFPPQWGQHHWRSPQAGPSSSQWGWSPIKINIV